MKLFDILFLMVLSLGCVVLWFEGYVDAKDADPTEEGAAKGILETGGGELLPAMSLPPGLRVDPATGLLMGVTLPEIEGVEGVTWELLRTYEYQPGLKGLPDTIKKLDGQKVVMIGFLMTLFSFDDIKDFHLVANHWSCCYGIPAGLDGAVKIKLAPGQEGLPNTLKPIRVVGTLKVKEIKDEESDIIWAIYSMDDAEATILDF
jgi:hypothetical protein